jgi:hypothetical protein
LQFRQSASDRQQPSESRVSKGCYLSSTLDLPHRENLGNLTNRAGRLRRGRLTPGPDRKAPTWVRTHDNHYPARGPLAPERSPSVALGDEGAPGAGKASGARAALTHRISPERAGPRRKSAMHPVRTEGARFDREERSPWLGVTGLPGRDPQRPPQSPLSPGTDAVPPPHCRHREPGPRGPEPPWQRPLPGRFLRP